MPARVLLAQKFAGLGGAQKSLVQHLEHLDPSRYEPHAVVAQEGWLTAQFDRLGVPWQVLPFGNWSPLRIFRNRALVEQVREIIEKKKISLVHANEHWVGPPCLLAARAAGIPAICHFRTGFEDLTAHRVRKYRYAEFDRVLAVAGVLREAMARHLPDPSKVVVVRDGVEFAAGRAPRRKKNRTIVITVGAIRRFKGQRRVVQGALPWLKANPRRYLALVGGFTEQDYGEGIAALVREHGIGRQVRLLGSRDDVARLYGMADALVAYSSLAGVPRVVMEAMLAGLPVIVSDTPGMSEVVDDEVGCVINFDAPGEPLARALEELSANRARWREKGARARERAARGHSTLAMARAIEAIYAELLAVRA